jgi:hypothetical protein
MPERARNDTDAKRRISRDRPFCRLGVKIGSISREEPP